jgi:cell pole-organizing protein PopZ
MGDINQDPSMEEILASIKRVIAEDNRSASSRPSRRRGDPEIGADIDGAEDREDEDVLELDDPLTAEAGGELVSPNAAAASRQALAALAAVHEQGDTLPNVTHGPLEAVVRDMLRPMLKVWLDQHLPELVEELVTREIARITGKNF